MIVLKGVMLFPLVLVILVMPTIAQTQAQQEWTTYEDPILGFSIQYPKDWKLVEDTNNVAFQLWQNETYPLVFSGVTAMPNVQLMGVNTSEGLMKTVMNMGIVELSETLEVIMK